MRHCDTEYRLNIIFCTNDAALVVRVKSFANLTAKKCPHEIGHLLKCHLSPDDLYVSSTSLHLQSGAEHHQMVLDDRQTRVLYTYMERPWYDI